jgi:hypothetical protein
MSAATTQALAATAMVVPCLKSGENGFEDPEEWKDIMEDHSVADTDRQELVREARSKDLAQATVEGRVYVVMLDSATGSNRRSRHGRRERPPILLWCAARATELQILPEGMVKPELRTPKHLQDILESWLEHGELSTVARRQKARYQDKYRRTDRAEQNPPWVVTMSLSSASTTSPTKREKLGKVVERMAMGFQMRDVPHSTRHMMKGSARPWENRDQDEKKRKRSEQPPPRHKTRGGTSNAARAMGGGGAQVRELVEQQRQIGERHRRADGRGSNRSNGQKKKPSAKRGT